MPGGRAPGRTRERSRDVLQRLLPQPGSHARVQSRVEHVERGLWFLLGWLLGFPFLLILLTVIKVLCG